MSPTQPRMVAGTPVGGQWAGTDRAAPQLELVDEPDWEAQDDQPAAPVYDIDASSVEDAKKRIAAANRRLEKAGIVQRFEAEHEPYTEVRTDRVTGVAWRC